MVNPADPATKLSQPKKSVIDSVSHAMVAFAERWFPDAYVFVVLGAVYIR
jgi:hypothetical protein